MEPPLQISFHHTPHSPAIETLVRNRARALDRFCEQITSCRVVVDLPHRHHEHGNKYQVRIDVAVPGDEIAVTREAANNLDGTTELEVAIRDAFDAATGLLEDYARHHRREAKHHDPTPHARVRVVMPGQEHGFLESSDGRDIYFHKNSLVNADFATLASGTEVTFSEELGVKGPQATTVRVVGRRRH